MKIKVYQCEKDEYVEMESLGKLRYVGESFGVDGLTDGKVYDCVKISSDNIMLSIVDDSEEDYMYPVDNPMPCDGCSIGGQWEIVEIYDDKLKKVLSTK